MKIYSADWIVTQDALRRVIKNGAIVVEGRNIVDVGFGDDIRVRYPEAEELKLGEAVLLPGFINSHTHTPMSVLRGTSEDKALFAWLNEDIFPREARLNSDVLRTAALFSYAEMIRTGTTCFYDMYMHQAEAFESADKIGIRGVLGESVTKFFGGIGGANEAETTANIRAWARDWAGHPRLRGAVTPHAVYTTDASLLRRLRDLADETGWQFGMHMSETATESAGNLRERGMRPIPWCHALGLLRPDTSLFHCVDVGGEEIELLVQCGCTPVHNPVSNMKIASGAAPVQRMLKAGLPVALGTDGPASNNAQNMIRDMWLAALLGKLSTSDPRAVSAQDALDMATRNGAVAVHDPNIGSLEPGKRADFCALDLSSPNMQPVHNVVSNVVYSATGHENRLTVVDGRELYKDGEFKTIDYEELRSQIKALESWARL